MDIAWRYVQIAETAQRLKTVVIADEVYGHLAFGETQFVPMGRYGSICPVLTLGSISKRWVVPGWRLGWFVTTDPCGTFRTPKVYPLTNHYKELSSCFNLWFLSSQLIERIKKYFDILGGPATFIQVGNDDLIIFINQDCAICRTLSPLRVFSIFICLCILQAAVPQIIKETDQAFFCRTLGTLKQASEICCNRIREIPCLTCPRKPEGAMAMMVILFFNQNVIIVIYSPP